MTNPWRAVCLTLFPDLFPGPLGTSVTGAALQKGLWDLKTLNFRDFAYDKHRSVDDSPAGGGAGMVMRPDVAARTIDAALDLAPQARPIYLSPRGRPFNQAMAKDLSQSQGLILLCGRFEGVDERVIEGARTTRGFNRGFCHDRGRNGGHVFVGRCHPLTPWRGWFI